MEQVDEAAHSAIMQANGTDKRGQGGAKATIVSTLSETEGGTRVEVNTDYHITGRLARFGRGGMIEDISQRLLREFAERLAESLKAGNVNERAAEAAATEAAEAAATEAAEAAATEAAEPAVAESVAQQPPTALDAGAVARSVLAERIRRNPIPLALIAGFLLAILLRRRAR
jgi:pyruvate/2-oxoglutarate dehydrogenase complex dihydrolipoamide acyltransferase (E2) component